MAAEPLFPEFSYVKGEYFIRKLQYDGLSERPILEKIKPEVLEKLYGINSHDKEKIKHYHGFAYVPENDKNKYFREIVLGDGLPNFNLYDLPQHNNVKHEFCNEEAPNWPNIISFLLHIAPHEKPYSNSKFTYIELLLDYLTILWRYPKNKLPILLLVSKERSTGKSTFLQMVELMFQGNARRVSIKDLESNFNSYWGSSNVLLVDETLLTKKLESQIRDESTSRNRTINGKFREEISFPNYTKFIMATNEVDNFATLDERENRYFVIEVKPFNKGSEIPDFIDLIKLELPQFLDYLLNHHQIKSDNTTRFWFDYIDYKTPALEKILYGEDYSSIKELVLSHFNYHLQDTWRSVPNEAYVIFNISNFRNSLSLDKGKEAVLKKVLNNLGFNVSSIKQRFNCLYGGATQAKMYSCPVGTLRQYFEPTL